MPDAPARVRFSTSPGRTYHVPSATASAASGIEDFLSLPLPRIYDDAAYAMDACTAAAIGDMELVKANARASPSVRNAHGWTPLHYAAQLDHADVCDYLITKGASLEQPNSGGQTPLMLAAACGNLRTVQLLVARGAAVMTKDKRGRTALHSASSCAHHTVVSELLKAGASPNEADVDGMTATLEACAAGNDSTLTAVLDKGGNPFHRNRSGQDGRDLAADDAKLLALLGAGPPRTLSELFKRIGLERYIDKFKQEHIDDLNVFFQLTSQNMDEMQIPYGPKKRLLTLIDHFKNTGEIRVEADPPQAPASPASVRARSPEDCVSSASVSASGTEELQQMQASLRFISQQNDACRRHALSALECGRGADPVRLAGLLTNIVECCEAVDRRLSQHQSS